MASNGIRLVQLMHPVLGRFVARVDEPDLAILSGYATLIDIAEAALEEHRPMRQLVEEAPVDRRLNYDTVYMTTSEYRLLPAADHPNDPLKCMVSGTGLTHLASADNRDRMHADGEREELTDSKKMYRWGEEGGKPEPGGIGVQPEWFYKGNGSILRAHGEYLTVPAYAEDGGEEPEIAGIYYVDDMGQPYRIGLATINEFSDHRMESKNYLYLAPSKIRQCALGPELVLDSDFTNIPGQVRIERGEKTVWEHPIQTGSENMAHSLENLEYHHFKYPAHRIPGVLHVHCFGADAFSYGEGIELVDGDRMSVKWDGMGRPLINTLSVDRSPESNFIITAL